MMRSAPLYVVILTLVAVSLSAASAAMHFSARMIASADPYSSGYWMLPVTQMAALILVSQVRGRISTGLYVVTIMIAAMYSLDRFGEFLLHVDDVTQRRFFARTYSADVLRAASLAFQTVALPWVVAMARRGSPATTKV